jgi:CRISPR-associated endonuclease/helicase Cas3
LADAFLKGTDSANLELRQKNTYPLLTHVAEGHKKELPFSFKKKKSKKNVRLEFLGSETDIERIIKKSLEQDQCVCWIRNSVKDARKTYQRLKNNGNKIELFHARFTIADIQNRILKAFDKDSVHEQRAERLVIATQVVEQSLDLDFDVMIMAPKSPKEWRLLFNHPPSEEKLKEKFDSIKEAFYLDGDG